jgi:dTDP-4-dehydrorhamnose reductase
LKKILLTGATGLFGTNFYLISKKFHLFSVINKKKINLKNSIKLDLLNEKKLKKIINNIKPDIIIHSAALTNIEKCESNKKLAKNLNIQVTKHLVDYAKKAKSKFVFISTDHLFNNKKNFFTEKDNTSPLNYYGKTKKISEDLIKKNLKNYLIIRTNFFGWGPKHRKSFSDIILEKLKKNEKLELFDDVYYSPVNVTYLCKIISKLIQKNVNGIFNVSSNQAISKYQFGIFLSKKFDFKDKLIKPIKLIKKDITKRPNYMSLSNKKIIKTLNISKNELNISYQINELKKFKKKTLYKTLNNF